MENHLLLVLLLLEFAAGLAIFREVPILKVVGTVAFWVVAGGVSLWFGRSADIRDAKENDRTKWLDRRWVRMVVSGVVSLVGVGLFLYATIIIYGYVALVPTGLWLAGAGITTGVGNIASRRGTARTFRLPGRMAGSNCWHHQLNEDVERPHIDLKMKPLFEQMKRDLRGMLERLEAVEYD